MPKGGIKMQNKRKEKQVKNTPYPLNHNALL